MSTNKKIFLTIFIFISIYYAWNGRNWILGPQITIDYPKNWSNINSNIIEVTGTAKNVSYISLNGREIYIEKDGKFKEETILYPGENSLEIYAKDRFNKEKVERIYLYNSTP